jgi:hypothetical protein
VISVAHHVEVAVSKAVKAAAKDGGVEEFVLAEHVQRLVGNDRAGERQPILRCRADAVHRLACRNVVGLDLVALIADNHVGLPGQNLLLQPPRRFVVDHGNR